MPAWTTIPILPGRYVTLRPLEPGDGEALVAAIADDLADQFYTFVPNAATVGTWMAKLMSERDAGRAMPFAVLDAEGAIAGTTRFMRMSPRIAGSRSAARSMRGACSAPGSTVRRSGCC